MEEAEAIVSRGIRPISSLVLVLFLHRPVLISYRKMRVCERIKEHDNPFTSMRLFEDSASQPRVSINLSALFALLLSALLCHGELCVRTVSEPPWVALAAALFLFFALFCFS